MRPEVSRIVESLDATGQAQAGRLTGEELEIYGMMVEEGELFIGWIFSIALSRPWKQRQRNEGEIAC